MTTEYVEGNLFDYQSTHAIAQGVNCQAAMASGIAAQFGERFPTMRAFYNDVCNAGQLHPGGILPWEGKDALTGIITTVLNCASQNRPGPDARISWLSQSLVLARSYCRSLAIPLAVPMIGAGIGGLSETQVREVFDALGVGFSLLVVEYKP